MYIRIHQPCCSEHDDGDNIHYFDTVEEAEEFAISGDTIAQVIKEIE